MLKPVQYQSNNYWQMHCDNCGGKFSLDTSVFTKNYICPFCLIRQDIHDPNNELKPDASRRKTYHPDEMELGE